MRIVEISEYFYVKMEREWKGEYKKRRKKSMKMLLKECDNVENLFIHF
jgi:hypothetical protein